jgi:hypothetical protein
MTVTFFSAICFLLSSADRIIILWEGDLILPIVVNLTLPYINSRAVILAKAGIQATNTGFRVKPGMTNKGDVKYSKDDDVWVIGYSVIGICLPC